MEDYTEKKIERKVLSPERGKDGLFIQTKEVGADREVVENHNRQRFASHFNYADPYTGNTRTFDEEGRYNCGRCNQADQEKCLLVSVQKIDEEAGSCGDWENTCAGDPEMLLLEKTPDLAAYGVAKNGVGFGCHRCPYASMANEVDSRGRSLYCGKGDFRVFPLACCRLNGASVVGDSGYEDEDKERSKAKIKSMFMRMKK